MRLQKIFGRAHTRKTQEGIVSIMVVSVLIVLLSLVTIGFARLMNRETRQALDRQLGLQSYYAAESGINDAIGYLDSKKDSLGSAAIDTCDQGAGLLNKNLSGEINPNAQYSCVLIDVTPSFLLFNIKAGQSKVFSFDQEFLTSMLISWRNTGETKTDNYRPYVAPGGRYDFTTTSAWTNADGKPGATGALEVSIYPVMIDPNHNPTHDTGIKPTKANWVDDRAQTAKYSRTFFLYPDKASNPSAALKTVHYRDNNGAIISGQCDDSHKTIGDDAGEVNFPALAGDDNVFPCNSILNCLPDNYHGPDGSRSLDNTNPYNDPNLSCPPTGDLSYRAQHYFVKITNLYADTDVMFRSAQSDAYKPVSLRNAQAVIDSTGKGNDVLRRISARVSVSPNGNDQVGSDLMGRPEFGLRTAETICKRIRQLTTNTIMVDDGNDACKEGIE
ncbi:hypothetical protein COU91_00385 [Candidatus Saccharibacteria bacterium CG10_big_fil_rev_8_21_14_0_10_47_8]|nr:MAG: hypothetical protein COU91_00385 [Candidatus Saccharibacteria bacterium CG10_big_fil_rev_8_21_14_0_10_47_8]